MRVVVIVVLIIMCLRRHHWRSRQHTYRHCVVFKNPVICFIFPIRGDIWRSIMALQLVPRPFWMIIIKWMVPRVYELEKKNHEVSDVWIIWNKTTHRHLYTHTHTHWMYTLTYVVPTTRDILFLTMMHPLIRLAESRKTFVVNLIQRQSHITRHWACQQRIQTGK